jgi:small-conductance mechanosensitive channel
MESIKLIVRINCKLLLQHFKTVYNIVTNTGSFLTSMMPGLLMWFIWRGVKPTASRCVCHITPNSQFRCTSRYVYKVHWLVAAVTLSYTLGEKRNTSKTTCRFYTVFFIGVLVLRNWTKEQPLRWSACSLQTSFFFFLSFCQFQDSDHKFFTALSSFPAPVIAPNSVYIIGSGFVPDGIIAVVAAGKSQWWVVAVAARHFRFSCRGFIEDD